MRGVRNTSMFKHHTSEKDDDDNEEVEEPEEPFLYLGDSWFGSVKVYINIRKSEKHGCFIIKISHSRSQKNTVFYDLDTKHWYWNEVHSQAAT